jgi:hypothetical protein
MFIPISIDGFVKKHLKSNPGENADDLRVALKESVERKRSGAMCFLRPADMGNRGCDSRRGTVLLLHDGGKRLFGGL